MKKHGLVKDIVGQTFGQLTVVEYAGIGTNGAIGTTSIWKCICTCGDYTERKLSTLKTSKNRGMTSMCKHGCRLRFNKSKSINKNKSIKNE